MSLDSIIRHRSSVVERGSIRWLTMTIRQELFSSLLSAYQRDRQHDNVQIVVDQDHCAISITASNQSPLLAEVDWQASIVAR